MQTLDKLIGQFFNHNEESLLNNYPGINKNVLQESFFDFLGYEIEPSCLLSYSESEKSTKFFNELQKGVPLSYITNVGHFYGREFFVNESVLIPRFETEGLVELAVEHIKTISGPRINVGEIGVGSGCIGLTILSECFDRSIDFRGGEISESALMVARKNYQKLNFCIPDSSRVTFFVNDRLEGEDECHYDLIVSNPPYIKKDQDENLVHHQVREFEPALALFIEDEVYESWFVELFSQIEKCLKPDGKFLMEGHENHLVRLKEIASEFSFKEIEIIKDLSSRDRVLSFRKS